MKKYVYKNVKTKEILFESIEEDEAKLTEVDIKFKEATGLDVIKSMWVAVSIDKI